MNFANLKRFLNQPPGLAGDLAPSRTRLEWLQNLAWTLPFVALYWIDLAHHQLWQDEINAWGIVSAAPTFSRLLDLVHWEGHPWLWYGILWIPAKFIHNPAGLKCVEVFFGTAIYLVIGLLSPFTRLQKALIFLSYYVAFEYTVLSRMYSVMLLIALIYVWRRARKPESAAGNLLLLGLLTNTDSSAILLSGALGLEYAYSLWMTHRNPAAWSRSLKRGVLIGVAGFLCLLAFSVHSATLAKGISMQDTGRFGSEMFQPRRIVESIGNLTATPWWPINKHFPRLFWASDAIENKWLLGLAPFVLYAYWKIFRRDSNLLLLMALTLGFGMIFADVIFAGRVRHWGIAVLAFLIALWIQQFQHGGVARRWSPWAYGLFSLGALAGVAATADSWTHPFSQATNAANWIRTHEPPDVALVGSWDLNLASMGQELQRPMYFMECACWDTFKLFAAARDEFPRTELPQRMLLAMQNLHTNRLVLSDYMALQPADYDRLNQAGLVATPLATFDKADQAQESYFLYSVTKR